MYIYDGGKYEGGKVSSIVNNTIRNEGGKMTAASAAKPLASFPFLVVGCGSTVY